LDMTHESDTTYTRKVLKHELVADELLKRINDGTYTGTIPSQQQLAEVFGVSKATTQQAIGKLARQGILESKQGAGTFIRHAPELAGVDPETFIIEAMYELPGLASYLGFLTRDAAAKYDQNPSGTNFREMMQTQVRMETFSTLASPVLRRVVGEPNDPRITGNEHLLVPMIRGTFSDELAHIEALRANYGGDIPGVTTSLMDIAAWHNVMGQDALKS
jgi:DNA-binding transcriptional regulator YhcF (GntR family)